MTALLNKLFYDNLMYLSVFFLKRYRKEKLTSVTLTNF